MAPPNARSKAQHAAAARWSNTPDREYGHDSPQISRIKLLTRSQVAAELGVSQWTIWDWVKKGKFPKPVSLSPGHAMKWREVDVAIWLQRRMRKAEKPALRGAVKAKMAKRGR